MVLGRKHGGRWGGGNKGFSLVEVVSSLGIISFGLMALIGLLPVGMQASRDSRETTAEAQITQYVSNCVRQSASSSLSDWIEPHVFYFDRQGLCVEEGSADVFYRVTLTQAGASGSVVGADSSLSTLQIHLHAINEPQTTRTIALHRAVSDP
jgi:uncharacterized protein (TIGR02598 family)